LYKKQVSCIKKDWIADHVRAEHEDQSDSARDAVDAERIARFCAQQESHSGRAARRTGRYGNRRLLIKV
jgi:hypothetical protein